MLRPQDIGVLSSIGRGEVAVVRRPRVRLVITGNELLPAGSKPSGFHIADANGPMLQALAQRDGAAVEFPGLVRDDRDAILDAMQAAADVVIVSGGSSVGIEDLAPMLVAEYGELAVHGIAMRPSVPYRTWKDEWTADLSAPRESGVEFVRVRFFRGPGDSGLGGRKKEWPYRSMRANLARKISSQIGRLDYARVKIEDGGVEPLASAGASMLSSTTRADGFVIVGDDSEGFRRGSGGRSVAL